MKNPKSKSKDIKCKYCYDKGYYTVAELGEITKKNCPRCKSGNSENSQEKAEKKCECHCHCKFLETCVHNNIECSHANANICGCGLSCVHCDVPVCPKAKRWANKQLTPQPESVGVEFEKCSHDDCLRDGAMGVCREREEVFLLENWKKELKKGFRIFSGLSAGHYLDPIIFIDNLLQAQAKQIRREEREKMIKFGEWLLMSCHCPKTAGITDFQTSKAELIEFEKTQAKILNKCHHEDCLRDGAHPFCRDQEL